MQVTISIKAEASDIDTLKDAIDILETTLPYIFDNVVVSSALVTRVDDGDDLGEL